MSLEEIELDNLNRLERQLRRKHGELSRTLENGLGNIRENLELYEIDKRLLDRVNYVLNECLELEDLGEVETSIRHLVDTFWHQLGD